MSCRGCSLQRNVVTSHLYVVPRGDGVVVSVSVGLGVGLLVHLEPGVGGVIVSVSVGVGLGPVVGVVVRE